MLSKFVNKPPKKWKTLATSWSWVLVLRVSRQVTNLAVSVTFARMLPKELFGNYQFVLSVAMLCSIFALPGMAAVTVQSISRGKLGTFQQAHKWSSRISLIGSIIFIGLSGWHYLQESLTLSLSFLIVAILFPLSHGFQIWRAFLNGKKAFKKNTILQSISVVSGNSILIVLPLLGMDDIFIFIAIKLTLEAIVNLYAHRFVRKNYFKDESEIETEEGAMSYGFKTSFYGIFNTIGNHLDKILLFTFLSPDALAIFAIAERFPEIIKGNLQSVKDVIVPELSKKNGFSKNISKKFDLFNLAVLVALATFALLVIPWLIPLLYGESYQESVLYSQILLISIGIGSIATVRYSYIVSKMDTKSVRNITIYTSIGRILLTLALVPTIGTIGACLSALIYRILTVFSVTYHLNSYHSDSNSRKTAQ